MCGEQDHQWKAMHHQVVCGQPENITCGSINCGDNCHGSPGLPWEQNTPSSTHDYLDMEIDYTILLNVCFSMDQNISNLITECPAKIDEELKHGPCCQSSFQGE